MLVSKEKIKYNVTMRKIAQTFIIFFSTALLLGCSNPFSHNVTTSEDISSKHYRTLLNALYDTFDKESLCLTITSTLDSGSDHNENKHYIGRYHNDFYSTWYVEHTIKEYNYLYTYYLKDTRIDYDTNDGSLKNCGKPDLNLESYFYYTSLLAITHALYKGNVDVYQRGDEKYSVGINKPDSLYKVILGESNMEELSNITTYPYIELTIKDGLIVKESMTIDFYYTEAKRYISQTIIVDYSYEDAEIHDAVRSLFED